MHGRDRNGESVFHFYFFITMRTLVGGEKTTHVNEGGKGDELAIAASCWVRDTLT